MSFLSKSTLAVWSLFILLAVSATGQQDMNDDALQIRAIYDLALKESKGYEWLYDLTNEVGGRLAGSPEGAAAVEYGKQIMSTLNFDTVYTC